MSPKVTVLMPVYNGEKYLKEAIDSILSQTFKDFEFLIINDGSIDNTQKIIEKYDDNRIRLINQKNKGLSEALNIGISLSKGEFIARMDADDISEKNRLSEQVAFMNSHKDVGICGSNVELIDDSGRKVGHMMYPIEHEDIKAQMMFNCPLAHPTVIFRKSFLKLNNLKYHNIKSEDYDLWERSVDLTKIVNINKYLLKYRFGSGISNNLYKLEYLIAAQDVSRRILFNLGEFSKDEADIFSKINNHSYFPDKKYLENLILLFKKIRGCNLLVGKYNKYSLDATIASKLLLVCGRIRRLRSVMGLDFFINSLIIFFRIKLKYKFFLINKIIIKKRI